MSGKAFTALATLMGLLAALKVGPAHAQMSDAERREVVKRVESAVSEIGLYGAQTNDSGDLGWGEGPILYALVNVYDATKDAKWLDVIRQRVDVAICFLTDHDVDGFLSWHTNYYMPELAPHPELRAGQRGLAGARPPLHDRRLRGGHRL